MAIKVWKNARLKKFIRFAETHGLGSRVRYQEAADLGQLKDWWRDCAVHLFEMFEQELADILEPMPMLSDSEVDVVESSDGHFDRCGDS